VNLAVAAGAGGGSALECPCGQDREPAEAGHDAGALEQSAETDEARLWNAVTNTGPAASPQRSSPRVQIAGRPGVVAGFTIKA
jgi:hypothetical protein